MNQYQLNLLETLRLALIRANVHGLSSDKMQTLTRAIKAQLGDQEAFELSDDELVFEEGAIEPLTSDPATEQSGVSAGDEVVTQQTEPEVPVVDEVPEAVQDEVPATASDSLPDVVYSDPTSEIVQPEAPAEQPSEVDGDVQEQL